MRWFFEPAKFRPLGGDIVKEREAFARAQNQNEEVFKKIGWQQLIVLLLNKGWFNRPEVSALEAALRARFDDAVKLISIENASR